ncbi:MAG: hypothetical protein ABSF69_20720 [Polyangiaceae bacterium]
MTSDAPATLVWIAPAPPSAAQRSAIASWAGAHGLALADPLDQRPAPIPVDTRVAVAVDDLIDHARDAIGARDGPSVDRALASAEALLRAHADLPEAAWQMAEVERVRATRWRRVAPIDTEAADRAWARAEALDGGRSAGVGEEASDIRTATVLIAIQPPPDEQAWVDSRAAGTEPMALRTGLHALVVTSDGAPVWAGWMDLHATSSIVRPEAPFTSPCSARDVGHAAWISNAVVSDQVRCGRWVAATAAPELDGALIGMCNANRCGPLLDWRPAPRSAASSAETHAEHRAFRWPAWATWTLAATGAVLAAGGVALALGAFRPPATEVRFISGGLVHGR